jgi:hypothetical protein
MECYDDKMRKKSKKSWTKNFCLTRYWKRKKKLKKKERNKQTNKKKKIEIKLKVCEM